MVLLGVPPHVCTDASLTSGLAVCCNICLVSWISRARSGRADQSRATTPTTCGPAIEVPERLPYVVSLARRAERTVTPGAETLGLRLPEPSESTGPRLL